METKFCKASLRPAVSPDGETGFFVSAPDYDLEKTFDCGPVFPLYAHFELALCLRIRGRGARPVCPFCLGGRRAVYFRRV